MKTDSGAVDERAAAAAADASLKTLQVDKGKLCPGFSPDRTSYAISLRSDAANVRFTAAVSQPGATLIIQGSPAESGEPARPLALEAGLQVFVLTVTAPDGKSSKTYEVKITRAAATPNWVKDLDAAPFAGRDSAGELVFKNRMWVLGGYLPELVSDVWSSGDGLDWKKIGEVPDKSGINTPVTFVFGGRMWTTSQDGKLYASEDGANWSMVTDKAPWAGRYCACGAVFAGRMWVVGGMKGETLFNDVWSSADGVDWKLEVANAPWSPRQVFGNLVVHNNKLWLVGGGVAIYQPFKAYRDVWSSPDGRNWTKVTDEAPWPARIWSSCAVYRGRIWLLGGFRAQPDWINFNDIWYSADGADWRQLVPENVWEARHEGCAFTHNDKLWMVAGNVWPLRNDVWHLHIPGLTFTSQPVLEEFIRTEYTYRAHADFNDDGGPVRYRLADGPPWLAVDAATGVVRGIPPELGVFPVVLEASAKDETAKQTFSLHVIPLR